jgi:hypothetical protein
VSTWSTNKKVTFAVGAVFAAGAATFFNSQRKTYQESQELGREILRLAEAQGLDRNLKIGPPYIPKDSKLEQSMPRIRDLAPDGGPDRSERDLPLRRAALAALRSGAWRTTIDRRFGGAYLDYDREAMLREAEPEAARERVRVVPDVGRTSDAGSYAARPLPAAASARRANPGHLGHWLRGGQGARR